MAPLIILPAVTVLEVLFTCSTTLYINLLVLEGGVTLGMLMILPHPAVVCVDASQGVRKQMPFTPPEGNCVVVSLVSWRLLIHPNYATK